MEFDKFLIDLNSTKYRLRAVYRTESAHDSNPFALPNLPKLALDSNSDGQEYPLELLNILRLTIFTMETGSKVDRGGFLELYQLPSEHSSPSRHALVIFLLVVLILL